MKPFHIVTPLLESQPLSKALGRTVFVKMEALQPTASFKIRGIGRLCQESAKAGATSLIASSGGNAGYAVAYAGRRLGIKTTVVVPKTTPEWMRERIRLEQAEVVEHGAVWDEAHRFASKKAADERGAYIHPFDHPTLWAGHATLVHELKELPTEPGTVVLSVGGGGLLCGVLEGLHEVGWKDVPVLAVETEGAASFKAAMDAGRPIDIPAITSVATSLGAKRVADKAFEWTRKHTILPHIVSDRQAVSACLRFAEDHRVLVEPACGAALAAAYDRAEALEKKSSIIVIACGGFGVTLAKMEEWRSKYL